MTIVMYCIYLTFLFKHILSIYSVYCVFSAYKEKNRMDNNEKTPYSRSYEQCLNFLIDRCKAGLKPEPGHDDKNSICGQMKTETNIIQR